jgi:hypothetical protein
MAEKNENNKDSQKGKSHQKDIYKKIDNMWHFFDHFYTPIPFCYLAILFCTPLPRELFGITH